MKISNYTKVSTILGGANTECMLVWAKGKLAFFVKFYAP
jgi:hypothetical protein